MLTNLEFKLSKYRKILLTLIIFIIVCLVLFLKNESIIPKVRSKFIQFKTPGEHFKYLNVFNSDKNVSASLTNLKCGEKLIPIFVHNKDGISNVIKAHGYWEIDNINYLVKITKDLKFQFIDIGSNFGVYSLNMACRGYDVISVEANLEIVKIFSKSIQKNNFENKVVLLHNAVTDSHEQFQMNLLFNDFGRGTIEKLTNNNIYSINLTGIYIDDLIPLIKHKNIVIKIDIEGNEIKAFKKAEKLFKEYKVLAVLIEWAFIKSDKYINNLVKFFIAHDLKPFSIQGKALTLDTINNWPIDVAWNR